MKSLIVLCYGLQNTDGTDLIDINEDPWKSLPVSTTKPNASDYREEVLRRYESLNLAGVGLKEPPRPKQWKLDKLLEWLKKYPLHDVSDVQFLQAEVESRRIVAERINKERATHNNDHDKADRSWYGPIPILRLFCGLTDNEDIRRAYLTRNDISNDRLELDNLRSDKRQKTVWELLSDKWNDTDYEAVTEAFADLHEDFSESIVIPHSKVSHLAVATPEKCKEKLSTMLVALKRIVDKWERSGQGDGGIDVERDGDETMGIETGIETGLLQHRTRGALESRSSFLNNNQPYLLYLWEILDKYQLLSSSFSALSKKVSSTNGSKGVKSVFRGDDNIDDDSTMTRTTTTSDLMNSVNNLSEVIFESFRKDTAQKEKSDLRKMVSDLRAESRRLELLDVEGTSKKQKVEAQLAAIAEEISDLSAQMQE
jgi:hypothetical protein